MIFCMKEQIESYKTERREKDANDRKTLAGVLDKKTRDIIDKLLVQRALKEVGGVLSVGKEASVYLGTASPEIYSKMCTRENKPDTNVPVAIKVYKTSAMVFKDRERYIIGERRFKRYAKGNSRKLVKLWAEKEVRNLNRLQKRGLPSPKPLFLRRNVLVMTMIGNSSTNSSTEEVDDSKAQNQVAAPSLKKAGLSGEALQDAYEQTVQIMCRMAQECGLVHADMSEYNLLYWDGKVYVIDVSQSVERDHPNASEFLRMDAHNVNRYFCKGGAQTLTDDALYEKIVKRSGFFKEDNIKETTENSDRNSDSDSSTGGDSTDSADESEEKQSYDGISKEKTSITKEEKKARKKEAKEAARERRKTKIPKKEKAKLSRKIQVARKKR